ncbi:MAG: chromosome segregation protein SMC [Clostridia bacterium]|nr:chromosome segregation protein SMC [Clostridia bacterium]
MRLNSITIQGFKSFPDKINIDFSDGLTAIVGPNGSGKSNISDAVRWVLGEMSAKSLRGGKMEDVIFNGTKIRKPYGFAEVSLTLDNADRHFNYDFNEITVTRRYFRSGESEYFINKQQVRLKDINELFMDTGLGKDGYSMIGQGRISEILSSKSEDRRQIFEEAAGISKFRYKKNEAERKLNAAEDNLLRLNDIITELEARVGPLKEQSEKAKKYLLLRDEKKGLEINVWLDAIDRMTETVKAAEEKYRIAKADLDSAETASEKTAEEINSLFERSAALNVETDELMRKIEELRTRQSDDDGRAIEIKANIARNESDIERIKNEIDGGESRKAELLKEKEAHLEKIAAAENEVEKLDGEMKNDLLQSELFTKENTENAEEAARIRGEIAANQSRYTSLLVEASSVSTELSGAMFDIEKMKEDIVKAKEELENREKIKEGFDKKEAQVKENKENLSNILGGWSLKLAAKEKAAADAKANYDGAVSRIASMKDRLSLLTDMEKNYVGFYNSIKAVMDASSKNALRGIKTTVAEAIKTDNRYALAMETLLGAALQNIITDTEDSAKAAVEYLKANDLGRATFLPINAVKGGVLNAAELKGHQGYIGIASELVEYKPEYKGVIEYLLGRSAVVETIGDAIRLARAFGYRFRAVTLDGQLINAGGSITGGSSVKRVGVFTRANEIEEIKAKLVKAEDEVKRLEAAHRAAESELFELKAKADGAAAELRTAEEELIKCSADCNHAALVCDAAREAKESLELALSSKEQFKAAQSAKKDENARLSKECARIAGELEEKLLKVTGSGSDIEAKQKALLEKISEIRFDIAAKTKDIEALRMMASELDRRIFTEQSFAEDKEAEIEAIRATSGELEAELLKINSAKQSISDEIAASQLEIQKIRVERDGAEQKINELRKKEKADTDRIAALKAETARLEAKTEAARNEYDVIVTRMWDEYELTLTEAESLRTELESVTGAQKRINEIKKEIKALGDVNVSAIEEYAEVSERYETLSVQYKDVTSAKTELEKIIGELTVEMKRIFEVQFAVINKHFDAVFKELFGGGEAALELSEPGDILNSGIDFKVAPPGKVIKNMSSLSGGEQALVAIALYFAILKVRPAPFCILDEIEAALDEVNVVRFADYLKTVNDKTQFIVITHRRGTMEAADVLYGVTMQEKGVSKLLVINVSDIEKNFPIK